MEKPRNPLGGDHTNVAAPGSGEQEALGGGARDSSCTSAQKRVCPIVRMEGGQRNDVIFFLNSVLGLVDLSCACCISFHLVAI